MRILHSRVQIPATRPKHRPLDNRQVLPPLFPKPEYPPNRRILSAGLCFLKRRRLPDFENEFFLSPKKKPHNLCSTLDPWIALPHFGFLEAEQKWRSPQLQKVCERIGLKQKRLKRISIWHPDNCHLAGHWVLSTNALESTLMICTLAFAPRSNRMSP